MNLNTSASAGESTLPTDGLLMLLTACKEVNSREALAHANTQSTENTTIPSLAGTTDTTSTMKNSDLQPPKSHEQERKASKRTMDDDDALSRPTKQQKAHALDYASADHALEEPQLQANASGTSQPLTTHDVSSSAGPSLATSEMQSASHFCHPMPLQEDNRHIHPPTSNSGLGIGLLTIQSPEPVQNLKRSLDDTESTRPAKQPRLQNATDDIASKQLQGQWGSAPADSTATSSTRQPSPVRANWSFLEDNPPFQESSTDTSSVPQQTQQTVGKQETASAADGTQDNLFDSIIFDVAEEIPQEYEWDLTESELIGLGIEPNEEELVAMLHHDYDAELDELLRWRPTPTTPEKCDFFGQLGQHIELSLEFAAHLDADSLVKLYSISKDFHSVLNGHLTHAMKTCAMAHSPEAYKIFDWRLYRNLCIKDPVGRSIINENGEEEVRFAPGLKWLQMVYHRERVVRDILAMMAREGIRTPKTMSLTVKKIWVTMDISTSKRRAQLMHNEEYWTDQDLYNAQMFFVKLDMYFNDPIAGPGDDGARKLMLGQRGLTTLLRFMKREIMKDHIEVIQWVVRYCYNRTEINKNYSIFGVPPYELGRGHREGWGAGRIHLYRPDELVMREGVRRNLGLEDQLMWMMLWGYVDPITKQNIPVTEEEMYISDEEEDLTGKEMDELIMRRKQETNEMAATEEDWVEWYKVDDDGNEVDMEGGNNEDEEPTGEYDGDDDDDDDDDTAINEESGDEDVTIDQD